MVHGKKYLHGRLPLSRGLGQRRFCSTKPQMPYIKSCSGKLRLFNMSHPLCPSMLAAPHRKSHKRRNNGRVDFGSSSARLPLPPPAPLGAAPDHRPFPSFRVRCRACALRTPLHLLLAREQGDSSADLDYYDQSSLALPGNAIITGENGVPANLELPPLGYASVYRLGTGASLAANKDLVVDTSPPFVVQVRRKSMIHDTS